MENIFHYHGDAVRRFLLAGATIMLIALPLLNSFIPFPIAVSLFAIIILIVMAGFMSPGRNWVIILNEVIIIVAILIFEYYAVNYYISYSWSSPLFIVDQVLAINFLFALYYNTKTFRSILPKEH